MRSKSIIMVSVLTTAAVGMTVFMTALFVFPKNRDNARWLLEADKYKERVLSQANSQQGDLKHIEWDSWGMAGLDTSVFLVYDPADKLKQAKNNQPGKFDGIPCEVPSVRALERSWYLVTFYTNDYWNSCSQ